MSGSVYGEIFKISTFGESHGKTVGAVIDGCPAGIPMSESDIQPDLDRRKPGGSKFSTKRSETDKCKILSGTFEGITTGTPIAVMIKNHDEISQDYSEIYNYYRPGHADYTYDIKYGIRDYRGGGRSSGRETAARVIGGAVARKILKELNIIVNAYAESIGPVKIKSGFNMAERFDNPLVMPDREAFLKAAAYLEQLALSGNSAGGTVKCEVCGLPAGIGQPVFNKLDAEIAKAVMSIGSVKAIEFGSGFSSATLTGIENNDGFYVKDNKVFKTSNHSGGVLGGISDGSPLEFGAAIKPTPSIGISQKSINSKLENVEKSIGGRHDPVIVPRAVVVIEAMTCISICDLLMQNMASKIDNIKKIYL